MSAAYGPVAPISDEQIEAVLREVLARCDSYSLRRKPGGDPWSILGSEWTCVCGTVLPEVDGPRAGSVPRRWHAHIAAGQAAALRAAAEESKPPSREPGYGTCPKCFLWRFIGHGPLCEDCYLAACQEAAS